MFDVYFIHLFGHTNSEGIMMICSVVCSHVAVGLPLSAEASELQPPVIPA
jgi:hypothetical protein